MCHPHGRGPYYGLEWTVLPNSHDAAHRQQHPSFYFVVGLQVFSKGLYGLALYGHDLPFQSYSQPSFSWPLTALSHRALPEVPGPSAWDAPASVHSSAQGITCFGQHPRCSPSCVIWPIALPPVHSSSSSIFSALLPALLASFLLLQHTRLSPTLHFPYGVPSIRNMPFHHWLLPQWSYTSYSLISSTMIFFLANVIITQIKTSCCAS